jgi:dGTP triphosphohydrolase
MNLKDKLNDFSKVDQVKFALFCAKQVAHLYSDTRVKAALSAAEAWVEDPSEDNRLKCKEAADAADAAAYAAADAADAAAYAAYWTAADAAYAAAAAADAAAAAWVADTAAWAAYWTTDANSELTEEGLFSSWLASLILEG